MIRNTPPATLGGPIAPAVTIAPAYIAMVNPSKVRTNPNVVGTVPVTTIASAYIATVNTKTRYFPIFMGSNPDYLLTLPPKPALTEMWC